MCRLAAPRKVLLIVVEGFRFSTGVSGLFTSAEVLLDEPCDVLPDGCRSTRPAEPPSPNPLADRVASRDERFRFGDPAASGDSDGKEVSTLGDPGFASELVRPLLDGVAENWDVERLPRMPLESISDELMQGHEASKHMIVAAKKSSSCQTKGSLRPL